MQPTTFANRLFNVVQSLDRNGVKAAIGDSTDNNRTLTVGQVARYLTSRRRKSLRQLGNHLVNVKGQLNGLAKSYRELAGSNRTDAIDIYELIAAADRLNNRAEDLPFSYGLFQSKLKRA